MNTYPRVFPIEARMDAADHNLPEGFGFLWLSVSYQEAEFSEL